MTRSCLEPGQRRTVDVIKALRFGVIEGLLIRGGLPCYERGPGIVQTIKLDSAPERPPDCKESDLTLKIEFERLFGRLSQLQDGFVDVEFRHGAPFRLIVKRCEKDLRALLQVDAP